MAGPTLTSYDVPQYSDDQDNWRAQDIAYIHDRLVARFPTQAALEANAYHNEVGAVAYVAEDADADDVIEPGAEPYFVGNTGNGWRRLIHSQFLRIPDAADTASSVKLRHVTAGSGLSLTSDGYTVAESRLVVGADQITLTSAGVISIKNGANTRTIQVNGTGKLAIDGTVTASAVESSGAVTGTTLTVTGATATGALTVTGTINATGTVTAPTGAITTVNSTTVNATTHASTNMRMTATGLSRADGTATLTMDANSLAAFVPSGFTFRRQLSETPAQVAGVVVSANPPSGTYPQGTIWMQVA